jgi:gliding motility-associated-like protein
MEKLFRTWAICVFYLSCNYISPTFAQTFSVINIPQHSASFAISANCNVAISSSGGGTQQWQGSSIGANGINGTAGSDAANCSAQTGLRLEMSGAGNGSGTGVWNNSITVTFTFPQGVKGPATFNIFDITESIYNDGSSNYATYQDKVAITSAKCDGTLITPTLTSNNGPIISTTTAPNLILTAIQLQGQCKNQPISIGTATDLIKTITIVYSNQDPPNNIPAPSGGRYGISQYQYVFISNIIASPPDPITVNATPNPVCSGQTVTLSASSTTAYSYTWASGTTPTTGTPVTATPATTTTFTVTGAIGTCAQTNSVSVNVSPPITPIFTPLGPYCLGTTPASLPTTSTNGISGTWSPAAISTAALGTSVYTFTPTAGQCANSTTKSILITTSVTPIFAAVPAFCSGTTAPVLPTTSINGITGSWSPATVSNTTSGTYTFTPSAGQCATSTTLNITVNANMTPTFTAVPAFCSGTTAPVLPTTSANGITGSWSPASVSNTASGTYSFTPTAGQCATSATLNITVNANVTPTFTAVPAFCSGTTAPVLPTTSANGITGSWSPASVSNTTSGSYTFTPIAGQCASTTTLNISVIATPVVSAGPDINICPGSSTTLTGSGGGTYAWNSGQSTSSITVTPVITTTYILTVTNNGCSASDAATVSISNNATILLTPSNPNICTGASVQLTASGVTSYNWSPVGSLSASTGSTVIATPSFTTTYTVNGSDGMGCTGSATITVTVAPITATASSTDENCNHANGSVTVNATGPCSAGFTYLWNTPSQQTLQTVTNLTSGTYNVTVNCGACTTTASVNVNNIPGPTVNCSSINSSCGNANGSATANISGGSAPYSYQWDCSPAQASQLMANVLAGTYIVTITDVNNCPAIDTVLISDTPGPDASISSVTSEECNLMNGSATAIFTGGTAPYQYTWSSTPAQNTQVLSNVAAGTYTVTVRDANGCSDTSIVTIGFIPGPLVTISSTNEICSQGNGMATATASQGSGSYTYLWNTVPAQSSQVVSNLLAGTYTVTVNDGNCTSSATITINNIEGPDADIYATPHIASTLDGTISFASESSGNIVNWQWTYGDGSSGDGETSAHNYGQAGTYVVTLIVTDNNGCTDIDVDTIVVKDIYTIYIPDAFTPNGDGTNDYFFPVCTGIDPNEFEFMIFNRWGNMIFETKTLGDKWNGTEYNNGNPATDCVIDVYVYCITVKPLDARKQMLIGRVTLVK